MSHSTARQPRIHTKQAKMWQRLWDGNKCKVDDKAGHDVVVFFGEAFARLTLPATLLLAAGCQDRKLDFLVAFNECHSSISPAEAMQHHSYCQVGGAESVIDGEEDLYTTDLLHPSSVDVWH